MTMSECFDERGQPVLFEQEFEYQQPKGHGSGQLSSQSEDWYTNAEVVELTRKLFHGKIDLDPMSCEEANRTVKAETFYTAEMDGLTRAWFGHMLWNPPWGGTGSDAAKKRGVKKLLAAYNNGEVAECICVLNANALTTAWFAPLLAFPVCVPPKRLAFYGPGGKVGNSPTAGTVVVYVGIGVSRFSEVFGGTGRIMVPYVAGR